MPVGWIDQIDQHVHLTKSSGGVAAHWRAIVLWYALTNNILQGHRLANA
jgi:hypothetical protein